MSYFPTFKEVTWPEQIPFRGNLSCVRYYSLISTWTPNLKCLASTIPKIMVGLQNLKMGHVTLTTPFQGRYVVFKLGLAMVNLTPNLKSIFLPITKIGKATQNTGLKYMGWFGVGRKGMTQEVVENIIIQSSACEFLLALLLCTHRAPFLSYSEKTV